MTDSAITCERIVKRYGNKTALNELTLDIPKGRMVGVLGPNGSGKSTLFRVLTGLVRQDSGKVVVLGQRPGWQANADIAYLPDRARWYSDHTVHQAFAWAEALLPGFDRSVAERLAEFMKLDPKMQTSGMSRGQEARLMLILCIARKVPLIILDEPFSGIDVPSRERIVEALIDYIGTGDQTLLISTHEIQETEALFDHAIFLQGGQLSLCGDTDELRSRYGSMHSIMKQLY